MSLDHYVRAWLNSGSVADHTRLLSELLRSQKLAIEKIQLAAYAGHEAAQRVCVNTVQIPATNDLWIDGLENFSPQLTVPVVLDIAMELSEIWQGQTILNKRHARLIKAVRCARKQFLNPSVERRRKLHNLTSKLVTIGIRELCGSPYSELRQILNAVHSIVIPMNLNEHGLKSEGYSSVFRGLKYVLEIESAEEILQGLKSGLIATSLGRYQSPGHFCE